MSPLRFFLAFQADGERRESCPCVLEIVCVLSAEELLGRFGLGPPQVSGLRLAFLQPGVESFLDLLNEARLSLGLVHF